MDRLPGVFTGWRDTKLWKMAASLALAWGAIFIALFFACRSQRERPHAAPVNADPPTEEREAESVRASGGVLQAKGSDGEWRNMRRVHPDPEQPQAVREYVLQRSALLDASAALAATPLSFFEGLEDTWEPTAAGLFGQTVDVWTQPDFLELSTERARELLPVASDEIGTFPTSLLSITGGLPTLEDCERAYESHEVRIAHLEFLKAEVLVTELQKRPRVERTADFDDMLDELRRIRDDRELAMAKACDRATNFKSWALLHRLYREWAK